MPKNDRFRIVSDNDGHEYFIPVDEVEEFYKWMEDEERSTYTEPEKYDDNRIDGRFSFTDPKCE